MFHLVDLRIYVCHSSYYEPVDVAIAAGHQVASLRLEIKQRVLHDVNDT